MSIRVLIVDDSPFAREVLREVLRRHSDIEVIGEAGDGKRAENLVCELQPDVVTMDVIMPMVGGLDAIRAIMARRPTPIVVVADVDSDYHGLSLQALEAGALATYAKPKGGFTQEATDRLVGLLREAALVKVAHTSSSHPPLPGRTRVFPPRTRRIDIIGIVASTGGPQTLRRLLDGVAPGRFPPIAIVQHTSIGFTDAFTSWLGRVSELPVSVARHGQRLTAGTITVAPDDQHLEIHPGGVAHLHGAGRVGGHRPSGTLLLRSLAASYGGNAAGVVLTGMGDDGAEGARAMEQSGGTVYIEDPDLAILGGMPRSAMAHTQNSIVASIEDIRRRLLYNESSRDGT